MSFYVATWRSGKASNQPSLKVALHAAHGLAPQAIVGRERFPMYASGPEAFFIDGEEKVLINALQKGQELRIETASVKDKRMAYHFSQGLGAKREKRPAAVSITSALGRRVKTRAGEGMV